MNCNLLVMSCHNRTPIQNLWKRYLAANWPNCPFTPTIISTDDNGEWTGRLIPYLSNLKDDFVLLMLDDHFVRPSRCGNYSANVNAALSLMQARRDIGMIKLQAGNAHPPEIPFPDWPILGEYDREHHPFKRTNLVPTLFRREWLLRLCIAVIERCLKGQDIGRTGAIHFEVYGTEATKDTVRFPERMLGIWRYADQGYRGDSILECIDEDGVREGKLKPGIDVFDIEGIEAFQCVS